MKPKNKWYLLVFLACGLSLLFLQGQSKDCIDADQDSYSIPTCGSQCGPIDCDDQNPDVNPGAMEGPFGDPSCSDVLDNDCDGAVDGTDSDCIPSTRSLPDTGIELCYDDSDEIPCPAPGEPFYGQDAQYVTNPMRFIDQGDGTVTDDITGLMWQRGDDHVTRIWQWASFYCEALTLAGHTDWRLPDEYELQGIVDYGRIDPAIDTTDFPCTSSSSYWSSVPLAHYDALAWGVTFSDGGIHGDLKSHSDYEYVRCVRRESIEQSFTDHGDGTVTDKVTGLVWQQEDDDVTRDWEDALAYCEELDLAGYADWRLPDIKELRSIVDNRTYSPAIDTTYFPGTSSSSYWSSSTSARSTDSAWRVLFGYGSVGDHGKDYYQYVRCVR